MGLCIFLQGTVTSSRGLKATERILKHLEKIDKKEEPKQGESALIMPVGCSSRWHHKDAKFAMAMA